MNQFHRKQQSLLQEVLAETSHWPEPKREPLSFISNAISEMDYWGRPEQCPLNLKLQHFQTEFASLSSITTYGGPASKYKTINEDSYFFGLSRQQRLISGVVDGSGGSKQGYLGGKLANEILSQHMHSDKPLEEVFCLADNEVIRNAHGGYATGVALSLDDTGFATLAAKGDARALTIREGKIHRDGTTRIQSLVAKKIEDGELPAHAIHTAKGKNIIYSVIGNRNLPLFQTQFQTQSGDIIILASDGLWDIVSDYEIQELSNQHSGISLQSTLFMMAYERNNTDSQYNLQFSENELHSMPASFVNQEKCRGDNITIQVIQIL